MMCNYWSISIAVDEEVALLCYLSLEMGFGFNISIFYESFELPLNVQ